MEQHKSRWALIPFWDAEDLRRLHESENKSAAQKKSWELELGYIHEQMIQKYKMRPFWNPKMMPADQAAAMSEFQSQIFPIWKGIETKWIASWDKYKTNPEFKSEPEVSVIHRIDFAICDSGIKPNREYSLDPMEVRRRAAMAEKYARVAGEFE